MSETAIPLARPALSDDGLVIRLTLYSADGARLAVAELEPMAAGRLAYDMLHAMLRHLRGDPYDPVTDAIGSYDEAVRAVGDQVREGRVLPPGSPFLPRRRDPV